MTNYLGRRKFIPVGRPHNLTMVFLGTTLIWFGWFAFNGGAAVSSNSRAALAAFVSTLAASMSGLSWAMYDYIYTQKLSGVAFCSGAIAGLVAITPAAGYVGILYFLF